MKHIENKAKCFAMLAHASIDHRRKYTGEPYIVHPAAVVKLVKSVPHTEAMIAAAWLHDAVKDTPVTIEEIEQEFGVEVASLVEQLTDISRPADGNRPVRKAKDLAHTARSTPAAQTIKLADLIDNTRNILAHDPKFATVYLAEKAALLEVLQGGDAGLMKQARAVMAGKVDSECAINRQCSALR